MNRILCYTVYIIFQDLPCVTLSRLAKNNTAHLVCSCLETQSMQGRGGDKAGISQRGAEEARVWAGYLTFPRNSRVIVVLEVLCGVSCCGDFGQIGDRLDEFRGGSAAVTLTALHEFWLDLWRLWERIIKCVSENMAILNFKFSLFSQNLGSHSFQEIVSGTPWLIF